MPTVDRSAVARLPTYDPETGALNVMIETPAGRRNKYKYDPATGLFELGSLLPEGAVFPYDFGFIPGTCGSDGDPLDVLVLMDEPGFTGCLVRARLIGVMEALQTENGRSERNDRLLAVALVSHTYGEFQKLSQLSPRLLDELEHFFVSYEAMRGRKFRVLGRYGPKRAERAVAAGQRALRGPAHASNGKTSARKVT